MFVSYFFNGKCGVLKLSEYYFIVRSKPMKKFHGDLERLQMCHTAILPLKPVCANKYVAV